MRNKQYKKTEDKILTVFFDNPNCTMWQLAKMAGLARSTIYTHYHSIHEIVSDCEEDILAEYKNIFNEKMQNKKVNLKMLYLDMLVFIVRNRQVFKIFWKFKDREVVIKMILTLESETREPEKILKICASEITEIIFEWGEGGFLENEMGKVLSDIMYLARTCHERLGPAGR